MCIRDRTSIYRGERPAIYAGYLIRLDYDKNIIIGEYLNYVMNSQEERQFCADVRVNGVCQANINAKKIGAFSIPVPPIDEQQYLSLIHISFLHKLTEPDTMTTVLSELQSALANTVSHLVPVGSDGQVRRVAQRFALCGLAGGLAAQMEILPPDFDAPGCAERCFHDWLAARGGIGASEDAAILAAVRLFIEQHGARCV